MSTIYAVHSFWFGELREPDYGKRRDVWFKKDPEFDALIKDRFWLLLENAEAGLLDGWKSSPRGSLALTILLDQFPRNIYRDTPRAFASDPMALEVASQALDREFDRCMLPVERQFLYLPFMHSERLADQDRGVSLYKPLRDEGLGDVYDYMLRHREIIAEFGRFPHRNAILGRKSTPEETAFLMTPGSSF